MPVSDMYMLIYLKYARAYALLKKAFCYAPKGQICFKICGHYGPKPSVHSDDDIREAVECLRKYVSKNLLHLPSAKKSKLPSHQVFGVFALEVNKILQATPSKLRRETGMCATTIYVQQQ